MRYCVIFSQNIEAETEEQAAVLFLAQLLHAIEIKEVDVDVCTSDGNIISNILLRDFHHFPFPPNSEKVN